MMNMAGITVVNEAGLLTLALKGNVLAHVERAAVEVEIAHPLDQRVDEEGPLLARHRKGADIDVRRLIGIGRGTVRTIAAVVVAVDVEDDETRMRCRNLIEQRAEHPVISCVNVERALDQILARPLVPDVQPPCLLRRFVNRAVGTAVEVEFKAREMDDNVIGHVDDRLAGERILLAQAISIGQFHRRSNFGAKRVAVVDRGRNDRPRPLLHGPPFLATQGHGPISASRADRLRNDQAMRARSAKLASQCSPI